MIDFLSYIFQNTVANIWIIGTFIGLIFYGYKSRTEDVDPVGAFLVSFFFSWFFVFWAIGQVVFDLKNKE